MTRILIADDHEVVRYALRTILESHPNWEVVAEAADGMEATAKAVETQPDVAVIDCTLPLLNGIEVTHHIRRRLPSTEVLIFTMHDNEELVGEALRAGARDFLLKSDAERHLLRAVEALAAHRPYFASQVSETLLKSHLQAGCQASSILTPRERQIAQLIAEGHSSKQIASVLGVSQKTVETHRAHVMDKLDLSSAAKLVRYAVRNKLVEP